MKEILVGSVLRKEQKMLQRYEIYGFVFFNEKCHLKNKAQSIIVFVKLSHFYKLDLLQILSQAESIHGVWGWYSYHSIVR